MKTIPALDVEIRDGVATIRFRKRGQAPPVGADEHVEDVHASLGRTLDELRWDRSVRVIVMTGAEDGEFLSTISPEKYADATKMSGFGTLLGDWDISNGAIRTMQALALIEKPVVARVNGDANNFGSAAVFGSDIIVAWEDAQFADVHMSLGKGLRSDGTNVGSPYAMAPGDGASFWITAMMNHTKAKEYLMLSRGYTAQELCQMNIINYAVGLDEIDAITGRIVGDLLARPPDALAYTKRIVNKPLIHHLNMVLDVADTYEKINLYRHMINGFENRLTI